MELIHQVRSKLGRKMVQRSKGRKSPLKHSQVGLMGAGGLKGNISEFMVKRQNILFYSHDIKKQLHEINLYMVH